MTYDVRNSGIPALAYSCDSESPVSLSLFIKCNDRRAQMTLCLQSLHFLQGFDDRQTVILQYDADHMVPGTISLRPATIPLPQERLNSLARAGNPQIRTLSLKLRKRCPVWCTPSAILALRPGCEAPFLQLAELARATQVSVLFDHNWLHRGLQASLERLIEQPEALSGFPVGQRYREQRLRQVDWREFSAGEIDTHAGASATIEGGELPPGYAEANRKRPRQVSTSPTPSAPPPKRDLLSPYLEALNTSPTEKGSTETPSPKRPCLAPNFLPLAALSPLPPTPGANSSTASPSSKIASPAFLASDLQHAVDQAVSSMLPNILDTLLPSLLPRLLTATSPSPSTQHSISSQLSHAAASPQLTALGISLHDRLANTLEAEISAIYAHTLSHANWLRNTADDKFADMLEEERLALERVAEENFQDFKERCDGVEEEIVERLGWRAEKLCDDVLKRLQEGMEESKNLKEELVKVREERMQDKNELWREKEELRKDREDLRLDKQVFRMEKKDFERGRDSLRTERLRFEAEKLQAVQKRPSAAPPIRAGSAPA